MDKMNFRHIPVLRNLTALLLVTALLFSFCSCTKDNSDFDGVRFAKTRHISVIVDSYVPVNTDVTVDSSCVARYIHDEVLKELNIDVTFIESQKLNINMSTEADISVTTNFSSLNTYYKMGSITNIAPYLDQYASSLTSLTGLLGEENIYACTDDPSEIWYLTAKKAVPDARVTFIRSDWLEKLGLEAPSTREELHNCLIAFRDNAELLLGEDADNMIPFFIDNEPNVSAKPLFDSCLDTSIGDKDFYAHGYCRATQEGYRDGLEILNGWYLEGLLPSDYQVIRPGTKESYEPVENGFVGAFCAKGDYLYKNGGISHIQALKDNQGEDADYVAVNTFENRYGRYTSWQEDYLGEGGNKIYLPSTCEDPLACLIYLNWISDKANVDELKNLDVQDPFDYSRYAITYQDALSDVAPEAEEALKTASEVTYVQRGNKCVRYGPYFFKYVESDTDFAKVYPGSTKNFVCTVISAPEGRFEEVYTAEFDTYVMQGAYVLFRIRLNEWDKVMVNGDMKPW